MVPRYGVEIRGGAEQAARQLAERVSRRPGWSCEVFTTRALESTTWADRYPAGDVVVNDVLVHRLPSISGRHPAFDRLSDTVLRDPSAVTVDEERDWFERQGPYCPAVVDAATASDCEFLAFYPYLYYPTVAGVPRAGERAVLHAAAHDERPLNLPVFKQIFGQASRLVFHTRVEQRLVNERFPVAHRPQVVLGLGAERQAGDTNAARTLVADGSPFVLTVGRVDDGKGSSLLARYFATYKSRFPGPLRLIMAGPVVHEPPRHPDIIVTGAVDDTTKWGLLQSAFALAQPSFFESFSIVLMEAWLCGAPVLVNGACAVTSQHCRDAGGGLTFSSYPEFEAALTALGRSPSLRATLGQNGNAYVESRYRWDRVVDRYLAFLTGRRTSS